MNERHERKDAFLRWLKTVESDPNAMIERDGGQNPAVRIPVPRLSRRPSAVGTLPAQASGATEDQTTPVRRPDRTEVTQSEPSLVGEARIFGETPLRPDES